MRSFLFLSMLRGPGPSCLHQEFGWVVLYLSIRLHGRLGLSVLYRLRSCRSHSRHGLQMSSHPYTNTPRPC